MKKRHLLFIAIGIVVVGVAMMGGLRRSAPRLSLSFTGYTNINDRRFALFALTNNGGGMVMCFGAEQIEFSGTNAPQWISAHHGKSRLAAGDQDEIRVDITDRPPGAWRFKGHCSSATLRTRLYDWQWRAGGPGPRLNNVIPNWYKGAVMDVAVSSDWMNGQ